MRTSRLLPAAALVAGAAVLVSALAEERPQTVRLTIVHTNDLHGHLENFAAVAQVAKDERAKNPNTLFLDGGDCITGTPVSTIFRGMPVFDVMNAMGYDAGAIGNHEFDHGWARVHEFTATAKHPLLCANAKDPDGKPFGDGPYKVFDVGGVKVGVLGLLTEDVPTLTTAKASGGCTFERAVDAARRLVPEVRKQSDLVVLLTHCGVQADAALAGSIAGIDVVVGGHSHTLLTQPLEVRVPTESDPKPRPTRVLQAHEYGKHVGVAEIAWDPARREIASFAWRVVKVQGADLPKDPAVQKLVDGWDAQVAPKMDEVIGRTRVALSKRQLRPLLERIYRDALGTDFGYQNSGGIRAEIAAGDIRVRDIVTVLPFDNTLIRLRLKGEQVPAAIRRELGTKFDPAKEYVFATNSYVGDQREKYFRAKDAPVEDAKLSMRDTVVEWVRRHGGFLPEGQPLPPPDESGDPR